MKNKIRFQLIPIIILSAICTISFIILLLQIPSEIVAINNFNNLSKDLHIVGIENFNKHRVIYGDNVCDYLIPSDEEGRTTNAASFLKKYDSDLDVYYEYNYHYDKAGELFETAYLKVNLDNKFDSFDLTLKEFITYRYDELLFSYKDYSFYLNTSPGKITDYSLTDDGNYIRWINIIGYNSEKTNYVFLGMFYNYSFNNPRKFDYPFLFNDWSEVFLKFFQSV